MRQPGSLLVFVTSTTMAWLVAGLIIAAQATSPAQDLQHPQGTNAGIFAFTGHCADLPNLFRTT